MKIYQVVTPVIRSEKGKTPAYTPTTITCTVCGQSIGLSQPQRVDAEQDGIDLYVCDDCGIEEVPVSSQGMTRVYVPDVLPGGWTYAYLSRRGKDDSKLARKKAPRQISPEAAGGPTVPLSTNAKPLAGDNRP